MQLQAEGQAARLAGYFRGANEGVIHYKSGTVERAVSATMRAAIIKRDDNACVLCGGSEPFEVDHARGLQNGGDNLPGNLATLCLPCHDQKTAMDKALRRQREKRRCGDVVYFYVV